jgi:predicted acetyltransferase
MGIDKLLITCHPDNISSERIIENNDGQYEGTLEDPYGMGPAKRFWVPT